MRAVWSGSLNFGLVTIPVKLYSATEEHDVDLHQVHAADHGRIRYQRVCEVCGNVVNQRDIEKAYEAPDGQMVVLTDDDFASLPADKSKQISVEQFAPAAQIDPLLFDRAYYLEPASLATKAYALLRTTLERTDRVAIVRFALRQRSQLGALRVHDDVLAVQTLRWPDEVRSFELPRQGQRDGVSKREIDMAETLVESYAADFEPDQFIDDYREQLTTLIDNKLAGGEAQEMPADTDNEHDADVLDLMAALERSVARRSGGDAQPRKAASSSKRTTKRAARDAAATKRRAQPAAKSGSKSTAKHPAKAATRATAKASAEAELATKTTAKAKSGLKSSTGAAAPSRTRKSA